MPYRQIARLERTLEMPFTDAAEILHDFYGEILVIDSAAPCDGFLPYAQSRLF